MRCYRLDEFPASVPENRTAKFNNESGGCINPSTNQSKKTMPTEIKPKRKANPALLKPVQPDAILAAVVGSTPASRGEITKRLWDYIKKHKLQDEKNKRNINADAALKALFGGKAQVTMFEMTKLVSPHMK